MAYATSHGQGTTSWARYVLALLLTGSSRYAPEVPAAPGSIPSYAASYRGQGLPTSRPKRPSTPRERRRDGELGPGPAMRVGARALWLWASRYRLIYPGTHAGSLLTVNVPESSSRRPRRAAGSANRTRRGEPRALRLVSSGDSYKGRLCNNRRIQAPNGGPLG